VLKHEPEHGYPDLRFSDLFNCNEAKEGEVPCNTPRPLVSRSLLY